MTNDIFLAVHTGPPLATNGYLIGDPSAGEAILVDAPHGAAETLLAEAHRRGLRVAALVNTHGHFDHIVDNPAVREAAGTELLVHPLEAHRLAHPDNGFLDVAPSVPTGFLEEGNAVTVGRWTFTVLHTPGHSEGGICLHCPDLGLLLSGDTLFRGTYGRTDLPGGDARALRHSLQRLAGLPPATSVLPGHGEATTIAEERAWIEALP